MSRSLALAAIVLAGCGAGIESPTTASTSSLDVLDPLVSVSQTGSTFTSTFSGDDASLSFSQDLSAFAGSVVTGGGYVPSNTGVDHASFGFAAGLESSGRLSGHV